MSFNGLAKFIGSTVAILRTRIRWVNELMVAGLLEVVDAKKDSKSLQMPLDDQKVALAPHFKKQVDEADL